MTKKIENRKIVIINQAVNYLTIGIANAFSNKFDEVALITGSIHVQGEELSNKVKVRYISKWQEEHGLRKVWIYFKAMLQFWILLMVKYRKYEVFFISVPPMGYLLNLILPHRFSMIIWDVFPDGLKITGMKESHPVFKIWSWLNKKSFAKAYKLYTIGERMADLLEKYVNREKIIVQPIWSIFQENTKVKKEDNPFIKKYNLQNKFIVQYSGNIGLTHNVETLVMIAEKMQDQKHILFQIIGRGPRKKALQQMVERKNLENCMFLPFQSDEMFPYSLSAADVGVVILDKKTSRGSVPGKSYNLMAYGIPSLYISSPDSELQLYADKFKHAKCFTDNQLNEAAEFILLLSKNPDIYKKYSQNSLKAAENFKRDNADKIVDLYIK